MTIVVPLGLAWLLLLEVTVMGGQLWHRFLLVGVGLDDGGSFRYLQRRLL